MQILVDLLIQSMCLLLVLLFARGECERYFADGTLTFWGFERVIIQILRRIVAVVATAGFVAGCAGLDSGPAPSIPQVSSLSSEDVGYQLKPGDRVKIVVFDEDRFSGDFALDGNGRITINQIGAVQASGLTVRKLEATLKSRLESTAGLSNPHVSVLLDSGSAS